jgi:hypothetical protein
MRPVKGTPPSLGAGALCSPLTGRRAGCGTAKRDAVGWFSVSVMEIAMEKNERSDPTFTVFLVLAFIFLFSLMYAVWPVPPSH